MARRSKSDPFLYVRKTRWLLALCFGDHSPLPPQRPVGHRFQLLVKMLAVARADASNAACLQTQVVTRMLEQRTAPHANAVMPSFSAPGACVCELRTRSQKLFRATRIQHAVRFIVVEALFLCRKLVRVHLVAAHRTSLQPRACSTRACSKLYLIVLASVFFLCRRLVHVRFKAAHKKSLMDWMCQRFNMDQACLRWVHSQISSTVHPHPLFHVFCRGRSWFDSSCAQVSVVTVSDCHVCVVLHAPVRTYEHMLAFAHLHHL